MAGSEGSPGALDDPVLDRLNRRFDALEETHTWGFRRLFALEVATVLIAVAFFVALLLFG